MKKNLHKFFGMRWWSPTLKKVSPPLLLTRTRPALSSLPTRVLSLMEIYAIVHFKTNRSFFEKPWKVKMWNLASNIECFFLRALLKMSMSFTNELFEFAFLLFITWPPIINTRSSAITQHVYLYILQDHWVPGTAICGLVTTG